jgi:hypothetical protein
VASWTIAQTAQWAPQQCSRLQPEPHLLDLDLCSLVDVQTEGSGGEMVAAPSQAAVNEGLIDER